MLIIMLTFRNLWLCRPARLILRSIKNGAETFHALKSVLGKKGYNTAVGDEGGFAQVLNQMKKLLL